MGNPCARTECFKPRQAVSAPSCKTAASRLPRNRCSVFVRLTSFELVFGGNYADF